MTDQEYIKTWAQSCPTCRVQEGHEPVFSLTCPVFPEHVNTHHYDYWLKENGKYALDTSYSCDACLTQWSITYEITDITINKPEELP